jgi:hypothetical protein
MTVDSAFTITIHSDWPESRSYCKVRARRNGPVIYCTQKYSAPNDAWQDARRWCKNYLEQARIADLPS